MYYRYGVATLPEIVEQMREGSYLELTELCDRAWQHAERLSNIEIKQQASQYISLAMGLISDVKAVIFARNDKFLPYIESLSEKVATKHDCTGCQGGCKISHDMHVMELQGSLGEIKKILDRLQIVALPLYAETMYPEEYRVLRNQMALIESTLTDLFVLESNYLVPKVIEAQKSINAGNH